MATHDYVIANASGAAVRADLNNALAAIVSNNSSATEPATTYPYMLWFDTTAGQLKMRNAADDGWVVVPVLDSSGRLLIGTTTALTNISSGATLTTPQIQLSGAGLAESSLSLLRTGPTGASIFLNGGSSGNNVIDSSITGRLAFNGYDGTNYATSAEIKAQVDGTPGADDMPGRLVFSTTADGASSPTERMRIESSGRVLLGTTSFGGSLSRGGFNIAPGASNGATQVYINRASTTAASTPFIFANAETAVGSISFTNTNTYFNDISDYRVKENVVNIADGITRVKQLAPKRFNFIVDPDTTVDGFLAHEVQDVVPHAVTGEKDAVDDEGKPQYQGIDQSKLVPLLTAALQEAIAKIETLEAKVAALEAA